MKVSFVATILALTASSTIHAFSMKRPTSRIMSTTVTSSVAEEESSILQDKFGHINSELATSIWNWDRQHRTTNKDSKSKDYSTRTCLRWVDEIAKELAHGNQVSVQDLVQEGMIALMHAMTTYTTDEGLSFEVYAKRDIRQALLKLLDSVPRKVTKRAKKERASLYERLHREPTLSEVAQNMNLSTRELGRYMEASQNTISVERTMEIYNPLIDTTKFLEGTEIVDEVEDFLEDQDEGDDLMWIHHEQITGPLSEMIPDTTTPTEEGMRQDVEAFLTECVSFQERLLLRLRFGLHDGRPRSLTEIGNLCGLSPSRVKQMEDRALEKLFGASEKSQQVVERYLEYDN